MAIEVSFTVPGDPVGKGRPRFTSVGRYSKAYTPEKTASYETLVAWEYSRQCGNVKLEGPISAEITAYFPIPKSASKKARKEIELMPYCTKKLDADNIAKAILDALNKIAYDDDRLICRLVVNKVYGNTARVEIILEELNEVVLGGYDNAKMYDFQELF